MAQSFSLGTPELAGFGVLGATAAAALSGWLLPGGWLAASGLAGAVILPLICTLPQSLAAVGRVTARLSQLASQVTVKRLPKGDHPRSGCARQTNDASRAAASRMSASGPQ